jgi:hypothetical protein
MTQQEMVQVTLRVPKDWLTRAEALAEKLSKPGLHLERTDALRMAIAEGFTVYEKRTQGDKR